MTRLSSEWRRLYLPQSPSNLVMEAEPASWVDAQGRVRAMVVTLSHPTDWSAVSAVWQAVQADLSLPAPAIAVTGTDGYQLWFSLAEPVPADQAHAFLDALRTRHLGHIASARLALWPTPNAQTTGPHSPERMVPAKEVLPEQWSAFVAADLAPLFADTPWLDTPPSPEGQADLLASLHSIRPANWQTAMALLLSPTQAPAPLEPTWTPTDAHARSLDPKRFLTAVMNDEGIELALRIEAAKALLSFAEHPGNPGNPGA